MADTDIFSDAQIVARTIYGEARNQVPLGQKAIACVIMNRARHGGWWGSTPREVCLKPFQFSCWNANDPNRSLMLAVDPLDPVFSPLLEIAQSAMAGALIDVTAGADSYEVRGTGAFWAKGLTPVASIGAHDFYVTV